MPLQQRHLDGNVCLDFINNSADFDGDDEAVEPSGIDRNRTQRFRAALRRILEAEAQGTGAAALDLAALNRVLAMSGAQRGLVPTVRGYGWGWLDGPPRPERSLWPIAFAAARLLEGPDLNRLKGCDGCGRLYLDASRNQSRRWCDMEGCGNRAKVARYRARKD